MRCPAALPLVLLAILSSPGCLSEQTKRDLAAQQQNVAALETRLAKAEADGTALELAAVQAELAAAKAKYAELQAKAEAEIGKQISGGAKAVETGADYAKPIAGWLFPPALLALNLIGGLAGAIRKKYEGAKA